MRRYIGWPALIPGVPARDLTDEEWDALTDDQRSDAERFYEKPKDKPEKPAEAKPAE